PGDGPQHKVRRVRVRPAGRGLRPGTTPCRGKTAGPPANAVLLHGANHNDTPVRPPPLPALRHGGAAEAVLPVTGRGLPAGLVRQVPGGARESSPGAAKLTP